MKHAYRLLCCLIGAVLLNGCGGGGGGDASSDAFHVSFTPNPLVRTLYQHSPGTTVTLYATLSPAPTSTVYVFLEDPQQVLVPGPLAITDQGGGSFSADLPIDGSLSVGQHNGNFNLHLCKDASCASEYTLDNSVIPYEFTVEPLVTGSFTINGVAVVPTEGFDPMYGYRTYGGITMTSGQTLAVTTSKAMDDSYDLGGLVTLSNVVKSPSTSAFTTWQATFTSGSSATKEVFLRQLSDGETLRFTVTVLP